MKLSLNEAEQMAPVEVPRRASGYSLVKSEPFGRSYWKATYESSKPFEHKVDFNIYGDGRIVSFVSCPAPGTHTGDSAFMGTITVDGVDLSDSMDVVRNFLKAYAKAVSRGQRELDKRMRNLPVLAWGGSDEYLRTPSIITGLMAKSVMRDVGMGARYNPVAVG